MKALTTIGWGKALRFGLTHVAGQILRLVDPFSRTWLLRLFGATIGPDCVIHEIRFFNLYRLGFPGLRLGKCCFIGEDCLLDLAGALTLGDSVTLAERVTILTHINVGYPDHPLQSVFPAQVAPVTLGDGCFIGAGAMLLPGVKIGARAAVAAGAVVTQDVAPEVLVAGVPAKVIRQLEFPPPHQPAARRPKKGDGVH